MLALPKIPRVQPWKTTAKGLVGCWPCFEGAGLVLHDIAGRANDGALVASGRPNWSDAPAPLPYGALAFSGANNVTTVQNSPVRTGQLTVTAWVNPVVTSRGDMVTVWQNGGTAGDQFDLIHFNGSPTIFISNGATNANAGFGGAMAGGQWYHLAGRYDGATLSIWMNGVQQAAAATALGLSNPGSSVRFGNNAASDGAFTGSLGEVRIYDRALAPSEIWDIYTGNG